jgi:hypothetical protein
MYAGRKWFCGGTTGTGSSVYLTLCQSKEKKLRIRVILVWFAKNQTESDEK